MTEKHSTIFIADDLGLCTAVNEGIRKAHHSGLLTNASILANGLSFTQATEEVIPDCPNLGVGIHLNLVEGALLSKNSQSSFLSDSNGHFKFGFVDYLRMAKNKTIKQSIEDEYSLRTASLWTASDESYINPHTALVKNETEFWIHVQLEGLRQLDLRFQRDDYLAPWSMTTSKVADYGFVESAESHWRVCRQRGQSLSDPFFFFLSSPAAE